MSDPALRNAAANGAAGNLETAGWFAIGSSATTQISNERTPPTYGPAATSVADITGPMAFTGPASTAVTHLLVWDAATAGSVRFAVPLTGDLSFNAAGDLNLTSADITVADPPP